MAQRIINALLAISFLVAPFRTVYGEPNSLPPINPLPVDPKVRFGLVNDATQPSPLLPNPGTDYTTPSSNWSSDAPIYNEFASSSPASSSANWLTWPQLDFSAMWDSIAREEFQAEAETISPSAPFQLASLRPKPSQVTDTFHNVVSPSLALSPQAFLFFPNSFEIGAASLPPSPNPLSTTATFSTTLLMAPIAEGPSTATPPYVFNTTTTTFNYTGGQVFLTSPKDRSKLCTDDKVIITVTETGKSFTEDYTTPKPIHCTVPKNVTYLFRVGINTVTTKVIDLVPPLRSTHGYQLDTGTGDFIPPTITILQLYGKRILGTNLYNISLLARITDVGGSGLASKSASSSFGIRLHDLIPFTSTVHGPNVYAATFTNVPGQKLITFIVTAIDGAGNAAKPNIVQDYFTGDESYGYNACMNENPSCNDQKTGHILNTRNPISTLDGRKMETWPLLYVPGPNGADINIAVTYNSGSIRQGEFGSGMSSELDTGLVKLYNPLVDGVEIAMGDGGRFPFQDNGDSTFTSLTPSFEGTLVQNGSEYLFTAYDQRRYRFNTDGDLIALEDLAGNAVAVAYTDDRISSLTTGGRAVNVRHNNDGYIDQLKIGEKIITLQYLGDKLIGFQDPMQGQWSFDYETRAIGEIVNEGGEDLAYTATEYLLTSVKTPEGRVKNEQSYDAQGRVTHQVSSAVGILEFRYFDNTDGSHETHIYDAYGNPEIHCYNALGQLWKRILRENYGAQITVPIPNLFRLFLPLVGRNTVSNSDCLYPGTYELYFYNSDSYYERKIDFNGQEWRYKRDDRGNILETIGPEGFHESWLFNEFNQPTFHRDGDGFEWHWEYSPTTKALERFTQPNGSFMRLANNPQGLPTDIFDFNNNHIENTYDPVTGDLRSTKDGEDSTTHFGYDQYGRQIKRTLPKGNEWDFGYDLNDNLRTVDGPLTYQAEFDYDQDNLLKSETDADKATTTYQYDGRARLIETRNSENEPTFFRYKPMNELAEVENARGAITRYGHDENYRVIQIDLPENVTLRFAYDGLGNTLLATDGEGRVTATTYDGLSRPLAVVENYIEGGLMNADTNVVTRFEHDYRRHVTKVVNALGDEREFGFDEIGRMIWAENEEDERTEFEYDDNSNRTVVRFPERNFITTEYNGRNQPRLLRDGEGFETALTYDPNGNLEYVVAPDMVVTYHEYNALDQRITTTNNYVSGANLTHDRNVVTLYGYSLVGDLLKVIDAENYTFLFEYDKAHRLIHETNPEGEIHYTYDDVGNLVERLDANTHPWSYAYDLLNRLTKTTNPEQHSFHYGYDRANNPVSVTDARDRTTTTVFDALNRPIQVTNPIPYVTDLTYDAVGNLKSIIDGNRHITTFAYDRAQRLVQRTDAEGFRVQYGYDHNGRLTLTRIPFLDSTQTIEERYTYDGRDLRRSFTNGEGEVTGYHFNNVGLMDTMTANDGVVTSYGYDGLRRLNRVTLNDDGTSVAVADRNVTYNYRYDRVSNLVSVVDPLNHETIFRYNGLGSLVYERNPNNNEWDYDYDPAQNLITRTDAKRQVTHYAYYDDNQLHVIDYLRTDSALLTRVNIESTACALLAKSV